ncbi:MAG: hypothetical protein IPL32_18520 [Chloracidobacterium sp.]|nr:hypothetical protein [Chloracidobacterium sp.]
MSRWFRIYDEALDDHKVQSLSPELFKTWFNLLCVASRDNGVLPTVEALAFALRVSIHDMQARLDELILLGLLDIREDRKIEPHNWGKRQWKSDDSKERVRKHRHAKRYCNDDVTVTVTPPESYTDTDTEPNGLLSSPIAARAREVDDLKVVNKFFGMKDDRKKEKIVQRAEGLGLNVDDLTEACNRHKPKNRPAYFTSLCVAKLQEQLPGIKEDAIRRALWDKGDDAYKALLVCILEAA